VEHQLIYRFDLARIQGNGDVHCPKCGVTLSPDDETEDNYCILEAKVRDNNLNEIIIQCQRCRTVIRLTGFSLLKNVDS
jgi:predicted RNA-binding Zn-ribbon protein involved in translation (DUF1610 family)